MNISEVKREIKICKKSLQIVQEYHCEAKDKIELSKHTKELILYILGGRSISLCHTVLFLLDSCRLLGYGAIIRLINETNSAIWYFVRMDNNDNNISQWFENKIISPRKLRESINQTFREVVKFESEEVMKDELERLKNLQKEVYLGGSEYVHPTFGISKMNLNQHTKVFDYEWSDYQNYDISIFISISQVIIEMLRTFLLPKNIYEIDEQRNQVIIDQISILDALKI